MRFSPLCCIILFFLASSCQWQETMETNYSNFETFCRSCMIKDFSCSTVLKTNQRFSVGDSSGLQMGHLCNQTLSFWSDTHAVCDCGLALIFSYKWGIQLKIQSIWTARYVACVFRINWAQRRLTTVMYRCIISKNGLIDHTIDHIPLKIITVVTIIFSITFQATLLYEDLLLIHSHFSKICNNYIPNVKSDVLCDFTIK